MAEQVVKPVELNLGAISTFTGGLNTVGHTVQNLTSIIGTLTKTGAALVRAAALLAPAVIDPVMTGLNVALTSAKALLKDFSFGSAHMSILIVPPVVGGNQAFFKYIDKKIDDEKDPYRPPVDGQINPVTGIKEEWYHAGVVMWGALETPDGTANLYKTLKNVFQPKEWSPHVSNGMNTFRPTAKVELVGGYPRVSWTQPT